MIPNILALRYASSPMQEIWSFRGRVIQERELWIAVMQAQRDLGLEIPQAAIDDYIRVKDHVDLDAIMAREKVTRHDVKARIETFCELAGHQHLHKGMTSRDLTENVEQLQVYRSLLLIRDRAVAALTKIAGRADEFRHLLLTARTHNVAAQPTTFGRRLAMFGEELLICFRSLQELIDHYPVRGLKGAVGTQLDQLTLFAGDFDRVSQLDDLIVRHLGFSQTLHCPGQVYPRSIDANVVNTLVELASGPANLAKTLRLMAGHETASEGFAPGQTGSSAMPHKMNSRSCERINGLHLILKGYQTMAAGLAGDQWNEGDVSCSVVRRVMLPDAFFAIDGLFETVLTVIDQMQIFSDVIERENRYYLPFLMTTTIMMEAVKQGAGRETAHHAIKEHALATLGDLRSGHINENDLLDRLAQDMRLGLTADKLHQIVDDGQQQIGAANSQVDQFIAASKQISNQFPQASHYLPAGIL